MLRGKGIYPAVNRKRHLTKFYGLSTYRIRLKRLPNEARAYVILRRKGQSITNISRIVGRSTSLVFRILQFNKSLGTIKHFDLRKIPRRSRLFFASKMRFMMLKLRKAWIKFILGESEKPP